MGLMTYILTQLFLQRRYQELALPKGDGTQTRKHARKVEHYLEQQAEADHQDPHADAWDEEDEPPELIQYDAYRAFYAQLSKITRQVWRFLKNCFREKHSLLLYQRQLKPLLQGYL